MAVYLAAGELPLRVATLVLPLPRPDEPAPDIRMVVEGGVVVALGLGASDIALGLAGERSGQENVRPDTSSPPLRAPWRRSGYHG